MNLSFNLNLKLKTLHTFAAPLRKEKIFSTIIPSLYILLHSPRQGKEKFFSTIRPSFYIFASLFTKTNKGVYFFHCFTGFRNLKR